MHKKIVQNVTGNSYSKKTHIILQKPSTQSKSKYFIDIKQIVDNNLTEFLVLSTTANKDSFHRTRRIRVCEETTHDIWHSSSYETHSKGDIKQGNN